MVVASSPVRFHAIALSHVPCRSPLAHLAMQVVHPNPTPHVLWQLAGSDDASLRLFGLRSHHEIQQFSHDKVLCGVTSIDCSFSGRYVFGGYDDFNCYVWDTISGKQVCALAGHDNRVSSIGLSYEGCGLCTASWDSFLKIWA